MLLCQRRRGSYRRKQQNMLQFSCVSVFFLSRTTCNSTWRSIKTIFCVSLDNDKRRQKKMYILYIGKRILPPSMTQISFAPQDVKKKNKTLNKRTVTRKKGQERECWVCLSTSWHWTWGRSAAAQGARRPRWPAAARMPAQRCRPARGPAAASAARGPPCATCGTRTSARRARR